MKIKFIITTGKHKKGDVLELPERKALQFIGAGFAKGTEIAKPFVIDGELAEVLKDAGFDTLEAILDASDEDLLAVDSIGKATVKKIRSINLA